MSETVSMIPIAVGKAGTDKGQVTNVAENAATTDSVFKALIDSLLGAVDAEQVDSSGAGQQARKELSTKVEADKNASDIDAQIQCLLGSLSVMPEAVAVSQVTSVKTIAANEAVSSIAMGDSNSQAMSSIAMQQDNSRQEIIALNTKPTDSQTALKIDQSIPVKQSDRVEIQAAPDSEAQLVDRVVAQALEDSNSQAMSSIAMQQAGSKQEMIALNTKPSDGQTAVKIDQPIPVKQGDRVVTQALGDNNSQAVNTITEKQDSSRPEIIALNTKPSDGQVNPGQVEDHTAPDSKAKHVVQAEAKVDLKAASDNTPVAVKVTKQSQEPGSTVDFQLNLKQESATSPSAQRLVTGNVTESVRPLIDQAMRGGVSSNVQVMPTASDALANTAKIPRSSGHQTLWTGLLDMGISETASVKPAADAGNASNNNDSSNMNWTLMSDPRLIAPKAVDGAAFSVQSISDPALAPRMIDQIVRAAKVNITEKGGEMTLRLDPPHLGTVQMNVILNHGVVTATLQATTESARAILQSGLADLKTALAGSGLNIDSLNVSVGGNASQSWQSQGGAYDGQGYGREQYNAPLFAEINAGANTEPIQVNRQVSAGRLDYFA